MSTDRPPLRLETPRLILRELTTADAAFMLALLNDEAFVRYIGDRGVRTEDDARKYLQDGTIASYHEHGYGMYLMLRRDDGASIGVCGLVRRDGLEAPDLGFALLPPYRAAGYASEACKVVLQHARDNLNVGRLLAIATPDNAASAALLRRLGMQVEDRVRLPGDDTELDLYQIDLSAGAR